MMTVKSWRVAALLLTALTLGMGFAHVMEAPARLSWDQALWVGATVEGGLYRMFGTLGAAIDVAAIVATIVLAFKLRGHHDQQVFRLSAAAAICYALALALWWAIVFPANLELATWLGGHVPPDWARTRARWESGHAINTLIQFVGFVALVLSVVREMPAERKPLAD